MAPLTDPRDERLALALAAGEVKKDAARQAGMSVAAARRRARRPEVRGRVAELVAAISERAVTLAALGTLPPDVRAAVARSLGLPA